jgi:Protein of unknown function (DUF3455)
VGGWRFNTMLRRDVRRPAMRKLNPIRWLMVFPIAALPGGLSAAAVAPRAARVEAPAAFGVADRDAILVVHAAGAQIYECKAGAGGEMSWVFREPVATLVRDGLAIGHHYVGPTWELNDGDAVTGRQSASAPGATPDDVALLRLDAVEHRGGGILKDAKLVLRLNTHGGVLKGECPNAGELRAEPYSADYAFLR